MCDYLSRERSRTIYAPGTEFQIGVITLCSNTFPVRAYATIDAARM